VSVDMPKMEVHARGEDCEHDELETVGNCFRKRDVVSGNAQHNLEMRTCDHTYPTLILRELTSLSSIMCEY